MLPNRHIESASPPPESQALARVLLVGSLLGLCWLGMQGVHELGHVWAAKLTGGRVTRVIWNPLTISRTDIAPNPSPRLATWGGPALGAFVPVLVWAVAAAARRRWAYLCRFFAGFCLVANGVYLGIAPWMAVGDAGTLLQHGSQVWQLIAFGAVTIPAGLFLWHGQSQHFGARDAGVNGLHAAMMTLAFLMLIGLLLAFGRTG